MHDGGGDRAQSVAALETILRELSRQGYVFRNVYLPEGTPSIPEAYLALEGMAHLNANLARAVLPILRSVYR
jgi:hypothetical protein